MPKAGWCAQCGRNAWLAEDGGCVDGHDASFVSNVYETEPKRDPLKEAGSVLKQAAEDAGDVLEDAGSVIKEAWKEAEPSAKEAAASAGEAARKAGEAAVAFGKRIVGKPEAGDAPPPPPQDSEPAE